MPSSSSQCGREERYAERSIPVCGMQWYIKSPGYYNGKGHQTPSGRGGDEDELSGGSDAEPDFTG